jgi:DNA-binding beta-propeller fold protein YncE
MRSRPLGLFAGAALASVAALASTAYGETPAKAVAHIPGPDGGWDYANVSAEPHRLYVARTYGVMAVDLDTGAVTDKLVPGQRVHAVLPIPGGDLVLSTNGETNTATLFHGRDGRIVASLPTGKKPDAAVFDPATGLVAVMDGAAGDITLIDPAKAQVVGAIPIGGKLETAAVDGEGALYVNVENSSELAKVDLRARKMIARYKLDGCEEPTGLIYSAKSKLLVSACANGVAKIVSPDGKPVAALKTGEDPDAVLYDAAHDRVLIPSPAKGGTLTAIALSGGAPHVTGVTTTETGARTGAFDSRTGRVYLPAAKQMLKDPTGSHEIPAPGAFEILSLDAN